MTAMLNQTMVPKVIEVDPDHPDREAIDQAVAVIRDGGLVVAPTETRYGLLARADRTDSLVRLFEAKNRSLDRPTSVFVGSPSDIPKYGVFTTRAKKLAEHFLPGPLTLVMEARDDERRPVIVNGRIGIRLSSSPIISEIVKRLGIPVSATSANLSGDPDIATVAEIANSLGDEISLFLDGGPLTGPVSTVVDVSGNDLKVLREGAISTTRIKAAAGEEGA